MQATSLELVNHVNLLDIERTLEERVRFSLSQHLGFPEREVRSQQNKEKYFDPRHPFVASPELAEVFGLMKGLNEAALGDDTIAAAPDGRGSFRATLSATAADIARHFAGCTFDYVELGPEPSKTDFLVGELLRLGARVRHYVGVDINPASKEVMNRALARHLPGDRIRHRITSFDRFSRDEIRDGDVPALVTSLGFQEGNEDPESLSGFYRRLLDPADLLLTEMQLWPESGWEPVDRFYNHPFMRRFSRIAFERVFGDVPSRGGFARVRAGRFAEQDLWAAVLFEQPHGAYRAALPGRPRAFITNFCLKYSARQYRELREQSGCQHVMAQNLTGDRSVVFQLTLRV